MFEVKFAKSANLNAEEAVREVAAQVGGAGLSAVLFFCSPKYDLTALGAALKRTFDAPIIGCTSAGEILGSEGYIENSLVCASLKSPQLTVCPTLIGDLKEFVSTPNHKDLRHLENFDRGKSFFLLFIDGLSMMEDMVAAAIAQSLGGATLVGASAGDGLDFRHAFVYYDGVFRENIAVLAHCETTLPFKAFHIQHFAPTTVQLVITTANSQTRTVQTINGMPAAEEYARAVGVTANKLTPHVFAAHPVMLSIGGKYFVRSIRNVNPDGSLTFYCAINRGHMLTVARRRQHIIEHLKGELANMRQTVPNLAFIFGSDCILRRLEIGELGLEREAKEALSGYPFIGVSTYGEQFGGVHVNHTLTALAIGE